MGEMHEPRVHQLFRTKDGWLVAAPFATSGETLNEDGYSSDEIQGTFYLVNHGTDISVKVHKPQKIQLNCGRNRHRRGTGRHVDSRGRHTIH